MGRKKRVNALEMFMNQSVFRIRFFEDNPQCKNCEYVDQWHMDFDVYNKSVKGEHCLECVNYTGWKYFGE